MDTGKNIGPDQADSDPNDTSSSATPAKKRVITGPRAGIAVVAAAAASVAGVGIANNLPGDNQPKPSATTNNGEAHNTPNNTNENDTTTTVPSLQPNAANTPPTPTTIANSPNQSSQSANKNISAPSPLHATSTPAVPASPTGSVKLTAPSIYDPTGNSGGDTQITIPPTDGGKTWQNPNPPDTGDTTTTSTTAPQPSSGDTTTTTLPPQPPSTPEP